MPAFLLRVPWWWGRRLGRDLRSSDWRYQSVLAGGREEGGMVMTRAGRPVATHPPEVSRFCKTNTQKTRGNNTPKNWEGSMSMNLWECYEEQHRRQCQSQPFLERFRDYRCEKCHGIGHALDYAGNKQHVIPPKNVSMLIFLYFCLFFIKR